MAVSIIPKTTLGKWSTALNLLFLLTILVSIVLVLVLGVLDFGDRWWDVTVLILGVMMLVSFITGIITVRKREDRSALVYAAIVTGVPAIIFILFEYPVSLLRG